MCEEAVKSDTEESCDKNSAFSGVAASASAANVCFDDVQQQLLHQRSAAAAFLRKDDAYRVRVCVFYSHVRSQWSKRCTHYLPRSKAGDHTKYRDSATFRCWNDENTISIKHISKTHDTSTGHQHAGQRLWWDGDRQSDEERWLQWRVMSK